MKTVRPSKFVSRIAGSSKHMLPGSDLFSWTPTLSSTYMGMEETKKFVTSKPATCKTSHCQTLKCTSDVKRWHAAVAHMLGPRFWSSDAQKWHAAVARGKYTSQMWKFPHSWATFWSSDGYKWHAAVEWDKFKSQHVQNTIFSGHVKTREIPHSQDTFASRTTDSKKKLYGVVVQNAIVKHPPKMTNLAPFWNLMRCSKMWREDNF